MNNDVRHGTKALESCQKLTWMIRSVPHFLSPDFSQCHCERSEAISEPLAGVPTVTNGRDCFASLAMTLCFSFPSSYVNLSQGHEKCQSPTEEGREPEDRNEPQCGQRKPCADQEGYGAVGENNLVIPGGRGHASKDPVCAQDRATFSVECGPPSRVKRVRQKGYTGPDRIHVDHDAFRRVFLQRTYCICRDLGRRFRGWVPRLAHLVDQPGVSFAVTIDRAFACSVKFGGDEHVGGCGYPLDHSPRRLPG